MVHWFDAGEFGMETAFSSSFVPMNDAPENAKMLNVVINDERGRPRTIPGAIAIYERDGGILWRHGGQSRRARDLVVACIHQAGNYDYCFQWVFHQDGSMEQETLLSGFMETRTVERTKEADAGHAVAKGAVGTLVAPNIEATNHQHFFSFRLDMDVDGPVKNELYEMNVDSAPASDNKLKNAIVVRDTLLKTEDAAKRDVNMAAHRSWKIVNPGVRNKYNQPAGYMLIPGETAVPYSLPDSFLRKVSGFTEHQLWATPYDPTQLFAAGDYVFDGAPDDGLPSWTSKNRAIDYSDVVLYYTVGVTHIPRIEDWPMMSSHHAGFKLVPVGFFNSNPAMGVPRNKG
jgi:primary-amine oxidase